MLDDKLLRLLKTYLLQCKQTEKLLDGRQQGPLGTFSALVVVPSLKVTPSTRVTSAASTTSRSWL